MVGVVIAARIERRSGARAEVALKEILSESRMVPMSTIPGVAMTHMSEKIDEDGNMSEEEKASPYGPQSALEMLLKDLHWYSDALAAARASAAALQQAKTPVAV